MNWKSTDQILCANPTIVRWVWKDPPGHLQYAEARGVEGRTVGPRTGAMRPELRNNRASETDTRRLLKKSRLSLAVQGGGK